MRSYLDLGLALVAVACTPASQYNRGINVDYKPSGAAAGQSRLVGSALKYADKDLETIKATGAVYLGELEAHAEKDTDLSNQSGANGLEGRMSLEAAQRGATHFTLTASDVEHKLAPSTGFSATPFQRNGVAQTQGIKARYALWRVEPGKWSELPKELRPEGLPGATTTTTAASASPASSGAPIGGGAPAGTAGANASSAK